MKIFAFLAVLLASKVMAGTCTSISRTNNSANTVLTSTKYNTDINTAYSAINALDGGCISDGTLEDGALNTTEFATLLNGVQRGCQITNTDTNTISIDKCILTVNGNQVKTTSANTVTWGCTNCSAQAASTLYYVYALTTSTGTTLNLLISTTAPGADGFDVSGNKVIGSFFNDASQDIVETSVRFWNGQQFAKYTDNTIAIIQDQKTNGTNGGTCTSGSFQTRTLNTFEKSAWYVTLSSNQIILRAGRYLVEWSAPASQVISHQTRLYDITNTVEASPGSSEETPSASTVVPRSTGYAYLNINATTTYEVQSYCQSTVVDSGFGANMGGYASVEVYTHVKITRLGDYQ